MSKKEGLHLQKTYALDSLLHLIQVAQEPSSSHGGQAQAHDRSGWRTGPPTQAQVLGGSLHELLVVKGNKTALGQVQGKTWSTAAVLEESWVDAACKGSLDITCNFLGMTSSMWNFVIKWQLTGQLAESGLGEKMAKQPVLLRCSDQYPGGGEMQRPNAHISICIDELVQCILFGENELGLFAPVRDSWWWLIPDPATQNSQCAHGP